MAFENNLTPFQINFYPTSFGADTLLNGGIKNFKYYSLCDKWAYYPADLSTYVPSIIGSGFVGSLNQTTIPNSLFDGSINQVPVSTGLNLKDSLTILNNGQLTTQQSSSGLVNLTSPLIDYTIINTSGNTDSFLGILNGFGIPLTTSSLNKWNFTPSEGGYKDSAIQGMSASTYLLLSVNKSYVSIANGNTVKIELPTNPGYGADSLVQMYGTQVNTNQNLSYYDVNNWDTSSDLLNVFNDNKAVLLFSPQIDAAANGTTWDNGYSSSNLSPYSVNGKPLATYYNPSSLTYTSSKSVGAYFVGSNIAIIWEPTFVTGFDLATGKTSMNITQENKVFKNYFSFNALINVNKFYNSLNNSFNPNYKVRLDTMLVWDESNNLLGVGVFNKPLEHGAGDQFISQINLYI
jgi:hypothetical protein